MPHASRPRQAPRLRLALAALAAAAASFAPAVALACPQCALGQDGGPARDLLVAGMMISPFVVAIAVIRAIGRAVKGSGRRGGGEDDRP